MATIYAAPKELEYDRPESCKFKDWEAYDNDWVSKLREYCKKHNTGDSVGFIFRIPRADGYAQYMVLKEKPLHMIHLPIGDAWYCPAYMTKGITLKDVHDKMAAEAMWAELTADREKDKK